MASNIHGMYEKRKQIKTKQIFWGYTLKKKAGFSQVMTKTAKDQQTIKSLKTNKKNNDHEKMS